MKKVLFLFLITAVLTACNNDDEVTALKKQVEELSSQLESQVAEESTTSEDESGQEIKTYSGEEAQIIMEDESEQEFNVEILTLDSADWSNSYGGYALKFKEMDQYFIFVNEEYGDEVIETYAADRSFKIQNITLKFNDDTERYELYDSQNNLFGSALHRHNTNTNDFLNYLFDGDDYVYLDDISYIEDDYPTPSVMYTTEGDDMIIDAPVELYDVKYYDGLYYYTITGLPQMYVVSEDSTLADKLIERAKSNNGIISEYLCAVYLPQYDMHDVRIIPLGSKSSNKYEYIGSLQSIHMLEFSAENLETIYSVY